MDHLGLEQAGDALRQSALFGIVVAVTDAADGGHDLGLRETLCVFDGNVLHAADALLFVKRRCASD